jgi:Domain of unknown function (DUF2017)
MRPFRRRKGRIYAKLGKRDRQVLEYMCEQVEELLAEDDADAQTPQWARDLGLASPPRETPTDPILARLLPDAYADPEQASEFRRLAEGDLRAAKLRNMATVRDRLDDDPLEISGDAQAWLAFLADCRLMLGTELEVTEDESMWPSRDPRKNLYLYLGWMQQELVETLMKGGEE